MRVGSIASSFPPIASSSGQVIVGWDGLVKYPGMFQLPNGALVLWRETAGKQLSLLRLMPTIYGVVACFSMVRDRIGQLATHRIGLGCKSKQVCYV